MPYQHRLHHDLSRCPRFRLREGWGEQGFRGVHAEPADLELKLFEPARRAAIERLALRSGEVVFDVGCGTGLSLPLLRQAVGARGHIVGIEQCPEMMALASACSSTAGATSR